MDSLLSNILEYIQDCCRTFHEHANHEPERPTTETVQRLSQSEEVEWAEYRRVYPSWERNHFRNQAELINTVRLLKRSSFNAGEQAQIFRSLELWESKYQDNRTIMEHVRAIRRELKIQNLLVPESVVKV